MTKRLSPENRALIERDGGLGEGVTDGMIEEGFDVETLDRLLTAARREGRAFRRCGVCGRPLDVLGQPDSLDCGGDCLRCVREAEGSQRLPDEVIDAMLRAQREVTHPVHETPLGGWSTWASFELCCRMEGWLEKERAGMRAAVAALVRLGQRQP